MNTDVKQDQVNLVVLPARKDLGHLIASGIVYARYQGFNDCLDEIAKLGVLSAPSEVENLRNLSVTNIMLAITPGEDGMGHEVYAKSVCEVEGKLGDMAIELDDLRIENAGLDQLLREAYDVITKGFLGSHDPRTQRMASGLAARIKEHMLDTEAIKKAPI